MKLIGNFKRNLLTGFAALFPILITVFLLSWLYVQLDYTIGTRVNSVCMNILADYPAAFKVVFPEAGEDVLADWESRYEYVRANFPSHVGLIIGITAAILVTYVLGVFLRGYIGSRMMAWVDRFFERFPVVKNIYPHARQVADFLFGRARTARFKTVVAAQYPRRGIYTLGFLTGDGLKDIEQDANQNLITVFIPTSPTPLTGFIIVLPPEDVVELDMSVDEAFRFCLTAGVLASSGQRPGDEEKRQRLSYGTVEDLKKTSGQEDE